MSERPLLHTLRVERGTVGRVELAYRQYIGGGQSVEPHGYTVHWQPDDSRGEWEQFVPFNELPAGFKPQPGDAVFVLTNSSGGLVWAVVIRETICFNTSLPDEDLIELARNPHAQTGTVLPKPTEAAS